MLSSGKSLDELRASIKKIGELLDFVDQRREKILRDGRDVTRMAKQAIIDVHTGNVDRARRGIAKMERKLNRLREISSPDLNKYLITPEAEFVEALCLSKLILGEPLPKFDELKVQPVSYLFGLLDCIGEMRRRVLDELRKGGLEKAKALFALMDGVYSILLPLAVYDNIAQGLRRKLDVVRNVIESTRSLITEEVRRDEFRREIKKE
jgi:translin